MKYKACCIKHTTMAALFTVHHKGNSFVFERTSDVLSDEMFYDRAWFVVLNLGKENIEAYADLYIATKYYGACYEAKDVDALNTFALP
jgi:hypothetical protein